MASSEFWWLGSNEKTKYVYVELGHHRPIGDNENPCSITWDTGISLIDELNYWRKKFQNTNVYRALKIGTALSGGESIIGPLVVDIDNGDENLEDALVVARKTLFFLCDQREIDINNLRIFFTGHKGFNLEIHPQALGIRGCISDQLRKSADVLHQITKALRLGNSWQDMNQVSNAGTVVDQIYGSSYSGYRLKHPYIRLHGSLNRWIMSDGNARTRMKIELTVDELNKLCATDIISRAEKLAS